MKYDGILLGLYALALVVIAVELFSMVALTVVIILLMVMIVVQKVGLEKMIKSVKSEHNKKLDEILSKVEDVSKRTESFKDDMNRQVVFVDNKIGEVKHLVEVEMNNTYIEISRKVAEIEERLNDLKQGFAAAIGSLDERLHSTEEEKAEESF